MPLSGRVATLGSWALLAPLQPLPNLAWQVQQARPGRQDQRGAWKTLSQSTTHGLEQVSRFFSIIALLARLFPLEKEMATLSSISAWRIPWIEEPGGLQSMGSPRVRHD